MFVCCCRWVWQTSKWGGEEWGADLQQKWRVATSAVVVCDGACFLSSQPIGVVGHVLWCDCDVPWNCLIVSPPLPVTLPTPTAYRTYTLTAFRPAFPFQDWSSVLPLSHSSCRYVYCFLFDVSCLTFAAC